MFSGNHDHVNFMFQLFKVRRGFAISRERVSGELKELVDYFRKLISSDQGSLPLLAYYPINRAVLDVPVRIRTKHNFGILETYDHSLIRAANFRLFFEWFRECEDIENENFRKTHEFVPHPQLHAVKTALTLFMPDFEDWTVLRKPPRMEVKKNGKTLLVNHLSDGEKCLMAMVGDIARRLAIANPQKDDPLHGEGVVLIDEIELHLHPSWQRMIPGRLLETFPNVQFFISTHSPQVIGEVFADSNGQRIFRLQQTNEGIRYTIPKQAYGLDSNLVLDDMMVSEKQMLSRNAATTKKLREINRLIDHEKFTTARKRIKELEKEINGTLPETVGASALIHMLDDNETEAL